MPPHDLVDLSTLDLEQLAFGQDEIRQYNPHRFEMELLHGVCVYNPEEGYIVGYHDATEDDFWVRGHIPDRPIFPGVLMVEAAAQLCSFYWRVKFGEVERFFGFGGIEDTKFRGKVAPGDRLYISGVPRELKPRRAIFDCQGYVDGVMVFETRIIGVVV